MGTKTVPGSVVNRRSNFPEGTFRGSISKVEDGQNKDGTFGSLNLTLSDNSAIDAEKEPGARPHFVRLTTWMEVKGKNGKGETIQTADADATDEENVPYPIRQAVAQFSQLAACVGAATVNDDGGVTFNDDLETFIEELRQEDSPYIGSEVDFVVTHRQEKKDGKVVKGGRTFVDTAFLVPEASEDAEESEEETEEKETTDEVEEVEEVEEEEDTPPAKVMKKAAPKPAPVVTKGSGKAKFVRKGGKR